MILNVVNHGLSVGTIEVKGIASSSVLLIGDCERIGAASIFDTPPESLIVGSETVLVPLAPR
jgi:spore germination protein PD